MLNYKSQALSQYFPIEVSMMMECLIPAVSDAGSLATMYLSSDQGIISTTEELNLL